MCLEQPIATRRKIKKGGHVAWKQGPEANQGHELQYQRYINECGYGPFLVLDVSNSGGHCFVTISVPRIGEKQVNASFLRPVWTSAVPEPAK